MISKKNSVTIITDGHSNVTDEEIDKIKVIRINSLMLAPLLHFRYLISTIQKTEPDLVIWYGSAFSAIYLTRLKSLGKPLIWDIDTDLYGPKSLSRIPPRTLFNPINRLYTYLAAAICSPIMMRPVGNSSLISKIIVPNNHLKNVLKNQGINPDKIVIIPSAIELNQMAQADIDKPEDLRRKLGVKPNEFIVTYFGAPHDLRGPDVAILSMPRILSQIKNVRLLVLSRRNIGDVKAEGEYYRIEEEFLKKLVSKLGIKNYVDIIPGFMDKNMLKQYLQISDVIVFPFRLVPSEPPLSIFEVMNLGKAVITTNLGGLREIIGNNCGLLVEPGNASQLANAIVFLAKNPDTISVIGQNAKRFTASLPDWNAISERFTQLLTTVYQEK